MVMVVEEVILVEVVVEMVVEAVVDFAMEISWTQK